MLPKPNRLTKKNDFDAVFKGGKGLRGGFLLVKILKNSAKKVRVGFVVSKKVSNKATVRNKIKRMLRAAVLSEIKGVNKPADIVIVALPSSKNKDFSQIQKAVNNIFREIK